MKQTRKVTITKMHRRTMTATTTALLMRCPVCQREVETLSTLEALAMLQLAGRMFDAAIASGQVHVIPVLNGSSRVCEESLFRV